MSLSLARQKDGFFSLLAAFAGIIISTALAQEKHELFSLFLTETLPPCACGMDALRATDDTTAVAVIGEQESRCRWRRGIALGLTRDTRSFGAMYGHVKETLLF
jgi:hypothetical protein